MTCVSGRRPEELRVEVAPAELPDERLAASLACARTASARGETHPKCRYGESREVASSASASCPCAVAGEPVAEPAPRALGPGRLRRPGRAPPVVMPDTRPSPSTPSGRRIAPRRRPGGSPLPGLAPGTVVGREHLVVVAARRRDLAGRDDEAARRRAGGRARQRAVARARARTGSRRRSRRPRPRPPRARRLHRLRRRPRRDGRRARRPPRAGTRRGRRATRRGTRAGWRPRRTASARCPRRATKSGSDGLGLVERRREGRVVVETEIAREEDDRRPHRRERDLRGDAVHTGELAARRRARSRARTTAMSASSSGPWLIRLRPLREARNASSARRVGPREPHRRLGGVAALARRAPRRSRPAT